MKQLTQDSSLKLSVCNELFGNTPFEIQCDIIAQQGFTGIEIAPFSIDTEPFTLPPSAANLAQNALRNSGLKFAGLHWLLTKPEGLHITSQDNSKRQKAIDHIKRLLELSATLGGGCLIFGSPKARNAVAPVTEAEAKKYFIESMQELEPFAKAASSIICLEALDRSQSNIINTISDTKEIIDTINSKHISSMFDFHNTVDETDSWEGLIRKHINIISHVHINRMDGSWPVDEELHLYKPAIQELKKLNYQGWISLEIFTTPKDPSTILQSVYQFIINAYN